MLTSQESANLTQLKQELLSSQRQRLRGGGAWESPPEVACSQQSRYCRYLHMCREYACLHIDIYHAHNMHANADLYIWLYLYIHVYIDI